MSLIVRITGQVSIGADEYNASLADDYNNFVNEMVRILGSSSVGVCGIMAWLNAADKPHTAQSQFIGQESGKRIRIWGTREPSNTTSVSKNITIQHW